MTLLMWNSPKNLGHYTRAIAHKQQRSSIVIMLSIFLQILTYNFLTVWLAIPRLRTFTHKKESKCKGFDELSRQNSWPKRPNYDGKSRYRAIPKDFSKMCQQLHEHIVLQLFQASMSIKSAWAKESLPILGMAGRFSRQDGMTLLAAKPWCITN